MPSRAESVEKRTAQLLEGYPRQTGPFRVRFPILRLGQVLGVGEFSGRCPVVQSRGAREMSSFSKNR